MLTINRVGKLCPAHLELLQVVLYMTFCNFTRNSFYPCYKDVYLTFPLHSIDTYFGGNVIQRGNCVILLFPRGINFKTFIVLIRCTKHIKYIVSIWELLDRSIVYEDLRVILLQGSNYIFHLHQFQLILTHKFQMMTINYSYFHSNLISNQNNITLLYSYLACCQLHRLVKRGTTNWN